MPLCPAGHSSADSDFCDRCGIAISASAPIAAGQNLVRQGDLPSGTLLGPSSLAPEVSRLAGDWDKVALAPPTWRSIPSLGGDASSRSCLPADLGGAFSAAERERMFIDEAKLLAVLQHPSLPNVTDSFQLADRLYMVMSLEEGAAAVRRRRRLRRPAAGR